MKHRFCKIPFPRKTLWHKSLGPQPEYVIYIKRFFGKISTSTNWLVLSRSGCVLKNSINDNFGVWRERSRSISGSSSSCFFWWINPTHFALMSVTICFSNLLKMRGYQTMFCVKIAYSRQFLRGILDPFSTDLPLWSLNTGMALIVSNSFSLHTIMPDPSASAAWYVWYSWTI